MRSTGPEWKTNLNRMLETLENIKKLPVTDPGVYLHLGCGPQVLEGFINIDKYQKHPDVLQVDMANPPLPKNIAKGIYSSHALEHLNYRTAVLALQNWNRLLQPEGKLYLAIPDLEEIMLILLDKEVSWDAKWSWYVYTLFGYQVDPDKYARSLELDLPDDPGQHHRCGFTKETIRRFLESAGFGVDIIYNYDGWGTPSIWVEAHK